MSNPNNHSPVNPNTNNYSTDAYTPDPYATADTSFVNDARAGDSAPVANFENAQATDFTPVNPGTTVYVPDTYTTVDTPLVHEAKVIDTTPETNVTSPVAEVKELKQSEPIISSTKIENASPQVKAVPQESVHSTNTSLHLTEDDENNIPAAIFETISSKLNPIAQKFGKGVGQLRQYAEEKFGTAEEITELPQEYKDLEKRVDTLAQLHHNFLKVAKTYNTPAYDYPVQLQESLLGFTSTVSSQIQQLSKTVSDRAQTDAPNIPAATRPNHPKTLSHALSRVALNGSEQFARDDPLGIALVKFGAASDKLGNARLTMDHEIVAKFNTPMQVTLKTTVEGTMKLRRQVQVKRLALDASKTHYRESSSGKLDAARLEVEQAEDEFVGAVEEATHAMKTLLADPETLRDLADFVQIQLSYFREAQDLFSGLAPQLEQLRVEQETLYRGSVEE